jgi:adenylate kinase family enzyme
VRRVRVVGNTGAGKTHLARRLARRLGVPHVELDALQHLPGWTEASVEQFQAGLRARLDAAPDGWVVDGNYADEVGDLLQPDLVVWVDPPRWRVMSRVLRRTVGHGLLRRELWNGNRERLGQLLRRDPEDNVVLWSWVQHGRYRETYAEAMRSGGAAPWVRLRSPRDTERWFRSVAP